MAEAEILKIREDLISALNEDVLIYYGKADEESDKANALSEMNHEDQLLFEHLRKNHERKHENVTVMLNTNGGRLETAIDLIEMLTHHYRQTSVVVCEVARSSGTFLGLCADKFFIREKPSAKFSDFTPVSGVKGKTKFELKNFAEQFMDTTLRYLNDGVLKFRSGDDVFMIINNISPFYFHMSAQHTSLDYNELKREISEISSLTDHSKHENLLKAHEQLKTIMKGNEKEEGLNKIIVFNGEKLIR